MDISYLCIMYITYTQFTKWASVAFQLLSVLFFLLDFTEACSDLHACGDILCGQYCVWEVPLASKYIWTRSFWPCS